MRTTEESVLNTLLWVPQKDHEDYAKWTRNLSKPPHNWPGGASASTVEPLRLAYNAIKPVRMLEIGFNLGASAAIWLNLGVRTMTSIDISDSPLLDHSASELKKEFEHFTFIRVHPEHRSEVLKGDQFDCCYIDGGHEFDDVKKDIALVRSLGIKKMLFDDWPVRFGPGVVPAIEDAGLKILATFGNEMYCVDPLKSDGY